MLRDGVVRLARPDEVCRGNRVVDRHHDLGFKQFAGRGLRSVFPGRGRWMGAAGGQTGAFRCAPRDRGMGGCREEPSERLHRIGNHTRLVILGGRRMFRDLASCAWSRMERCLSDDGEAAYGTPLRVAESWVSPTKFRGTRYQAANGTCVGRGKGSARAHGRSTDPHGEAKDRYGVPRRRDAGRRVRDRAPLPAAWALRAAQSGRSARALRSMYPQGAALSDVRRAQGRTHGIASVRCVRVLMSNRSFVSPGASNARNPENRPPSTPPAGPRSRPTAPRRTRYSQGTAVLGGSNAIPPSATPPSAKTTPGSGPATRPQTTRSSTPSPFPSSSTTRGSCSSPSTASPTPVTPMPTSASRSCTPSQDPADRTHTPTETAISEPGHPTRQASRSPRIRRSGPLAPRSALPPGRRRPHISQSQTRTRRPAPRSRLRSHHSNKHGISLEPSPGGDRPDRCHTPNPGRPRNQHRACNAPAPVPRIPHTTKTGRFSLPSSNGRKSSEHGEGLYRSLTVSWTCSKSTLVMT